MQITADINPEELKKVFNLLKKPIQVWKLKTDAKCSKYRTIHSQLKFDLKKNTFFHNSFPQKKVSIIFKITGELLGFNWLPHREDLPIPIIDTKLCNLKDKEDVSFCRQMYNFKRILRKVLWDNRIGQEWMMSVL